MSYCSHCGQAIPAGDDVHFCPHCGKKVGAEVGGDPEIVSLLKAGKGIEAIKRYRQATGSGLQEARTAIYALAAKNGVAVTSGVSLSTGGGWIVRLLISLFAGLMTATAGIALFPDLGVVAKPFVCDDLAVVSQHYSYKPGQSGVTRTFYCGTETVNFKVMFFSFLIYTAIFFAGLTAWKALRWLFGKKDA